MPMFMPVDSLPAQEPETGLVASARKPPAGEGMRWQGGLSWRPERCFATQGFDPCGDDFEAAQGNADNSAVYYMPKAFRVSDDCSTMSGRLDPVRVRRQVMAATSYRVARELWTGALTVANPHTIPGPTGGNVAGQVNPYLTGPSAVLAEGGSYTPQQALGILEDHARRAANGQQVFIHISPMVLPFLENMVRRVGALILTTNDSVVVADPGYLGTAPGGGSGGTTTEQYMYATGPVTVRLGDPVVYDLDVERIIRSVNTQVDIGERVFAATFDPCVHFAILAALPGNQTPTP